MFSRRTPKFPSQVISHWYALAPGVHFSASDFYESVLDEIAARKMPQLKTSRVEYHEGGILSDRRIYLRLTRERFAFDVCAAPFGDGYFFSLRFVEVPRAGWLLLISFFVLAGLVWLAASLLPADAYWWVVLVLLISLLVRWLVKAARRKSEAPTASVPTRKPIMPDFDSFFLGLPVFGDWYEKARKNTYYRHDSRLLYHGIISEIVKTKVDEFTAAKGVKLIRTYDYNPILGELYKPAKIKPGAEHDGD